MMHWDRPCTSTSFIITFVGCNTNNEREKRNEIIQTWLEQNIQNADKYKLVASITTSYAQYDTEKPQNIPENYNTDYEIHIFKPEKKLKIITTDSVINEQGLIKKIESTSYFSIENDTLTLYQSDDTGSKKKTYQGKELTEAITSIVFPNDASIFNGEVILTGIADDDRKSLGVQRSVDAEPFKRPLYLITGEQPTNETGISLNFSYDTVRETMYSLSIEGFYKYYDDIYTLLNGKEYKNIYTENNLKYDQSLRIYFLELNKAEDFELPTVE